MIRIFLIGYMGAGKTTVGKELAERGGLSFIDLDNYIESRFHKTVGQLFEERGESGFRDLEHKMLQEVASFEDVIISTGGGAPCYFDNMEYMNQMGTTVYLKVSVNELVKRLNVCKHTRPILKNRSGEELRKFVADSLKTRDRFYEQASVVFDAEVMLTEADIKSIVEKLYQMIAEN